MFQPNRSDYDVSMTGRRVGEDCEHMKELRQLGRVSVGCACKLMESSSFSLFMCWNMQLRSVTTVHKIYGYDFILVFVDPGPYQYCCYEQRKVD